MALKTSIGFLGMGSMGTQMALRLLQGGYPLTVYDRTAEKTGEAVKNGARVADTPRDLAINVEVVMSCVTNYQALQALFDGPQGAISGARPGSLFIDLSTIAPDETRALAQKVSNQKASMLDAAVSGSVPQVVNGQLLIFVGGDKGDFERSQPILKHLAHKIFYLGANGAGDTMKMVINTLLGLEMQAIAEATTLGEKAGLDRELILDILEQSTVIAPAHQAKLKNIRQGVFPADFALPLMVKDFDLIARLAREHQVPMPATAMAEQMFIAALAQGSQDDFSSIQRFMAQLAGLPSQDEHEV